MNPPSVSLKYKRPSDDFAIRSINVVFFLSDTKFFLSIWTIFLRKSGSVSLHLAVEIGVKLLQKKALRIAKA